MTASDSRECCRREVLGLEGIMWVWLIVGGGIRILKVDGGVVGQVTRRSAHDFR
jgi:hypothetical protein